MKINVDSITFLKLKKLAEKYNVSIPKMATIIIKQYLSIRGEKVNDD